MERVPSRHATDILCSLWYLIPETRQQFTESLRDEYFRLGAAKEVVGEIASRAVSDSGTIAHDAYEFVTVASSLDIGLPVEVLVRALGVDYADWIETVGVGRPLWGLLYDAHDESNDTVAYFTRNEVVTRVLLDLVNGSVGHAGEFRILKRLLAACNGGSLVYRNFALSVLVRARKRLGEFLSYEQGLELFDIAKKALPFEDRILEHHRGIWMQDVGNHDALAYRQFEKALLTEIYPGADRDAPKEHIHTSMASAVVKMIKAGEQDPNKGALLVQDHLRQASSSRFFNPHTSHVSALLLFNLSELQTDSQDSSLALGYLVEALQEIERARQVVGGRRDVRFRKHLEMMTDLEKRVLASVPDDVELRALAKEMFDGSGSQVGFEIAARRLLVEASKLSRGRDFNIVNDYLNDCMTAIESASRTPSVALLVVRVDLFVRWTIQRFKATPWTELRDDLSDILKDVQYRDDVIRTFYLAVTLFHCNQVTEANALFATLRRWQPTAFGLREVRCFFLGDTGAPKRFQGTFRRDLGRWYFEIPELNVSILSRAPATHGSGATGHAYIGFALNGPLAQEDHPEPGDIVFW